MENSELLALDALAGEAPRTWAVLTTRSTDPNPASFYEARRAVIDALRRRWPGVEYAALVEFTTGYGEKSGGGRRPHWNLLLKGVDPGAVYEPPSRSSRKRETVEEVIRRVWCDRDDVDAEPWAQFVGSVSEVGGLLRYIALHFQKESQAPPQGWSGHRFLHSRGYLTGSTAEARAAARESLAHKRELWRAIKRGLTSEDAETAATEARALAAATSWTLIDFTRALTASSRPTGGGGAPESAPPLPDAGSRPDRLPEVDGVGSTAAGSDRAGGRGSSETNRPATRLDGRPATLDGTCELGDQADDADALVRSSPAEP